MKTPARLLLAALILLGSASGADNPTASAPAPAPDRSAPLTLHVWPAADGMFPGYPGDGQPESRVGMEQFEHVSVPTLTVYWPAPDKDLGIAMIVAPGGGYTAVYANKEGEQPARWLAARGITAIVLKYRVPNLPANPRYLAGMQDLQRSVSLVRSKAKEWSLDPNRIGVIGFSAGGQMEADVATNFNALSYPALDDIDKVSSRPDFVVMAYPGGLANRGATAITASEVHITNQTPPTFITIGYQDSNGSENGAVLYLALLHAGVAAELHIYEDVGHGFGLVEGPNPHNTWQDRMMDWLKYNQFLQRTDGANPAGPPAPVLSEQAAAAARAGRGGATTGGRRGVGRGAAAPAPNPAPTPPAAATAAPAGP